MTEPPAGRASEDRPTMSGNIPMDGNRMHGSSEAQDSYARMAPKYVDAPLPVTAHRSVGLTSENNAAGRSRSGPNANTLPHEIMTSDRRLSQHMNEYPKTSGSSHPHQQTHYERRDRSNRPTRFGPEQAKQPTSDSVPSEPRIWITREESQRFESRAREQQPVEEPTRRDEPRPSRTATLPWYPQGHENPTTGADLPTRGDRMQRSEGNAGLPVADATRPTHESDFASERGRGGGSSGDQRRSSFSLENRISTHYEGQLSEGRYRTSQALPSSLPARPIAPATHVQAQPPPYRDGGDRPQYREEGGASWEHSDSNAVRNPSPSNGARVHPDRARYLQTVTNPVPEPDEDASMKTSKPVRIRRPPPMSTKQHQEDYGPSRSSRDSRANYRGTPAAVMEPESSDARPEIRRAGAPPQSLRDRVDLYSQGTSEGSGNMHTDSPMDAEYDGGGHSSEFTFRGMRGGKRRGRRGRRGGMPM
ncbi:uncharacterized protein LAESUDRAFT_89557 [Laetiporus sulphureus 93-53]|uniref:Uncharacterized protein n=1 Tax=Laetiporus sulphureus 93-53 TaxID=1314785 RepID=A0A165EXW1_9APHY|nr:uncharacterized protein LAESUDRAFT_89557 [Laetiporus sulphureus 93-53]KZT07944.1 hypothetical protein LAESUDRAFT_89557 [Laetiporus sulphureus 93-53]